jgi:hypothetical protein
MLPDFKKLKMQLTIKKFIRNYFLIFTGVILGSVAGYLYWKFAGCEGSCTITSSPLNSTLYGALVGGLLFSMFKKKKTLDDPGNEKAA